MKIGLLSAPVLKDGHRMLPVRTIAEMMSEKAAVSWNPSAKFDGRTFEFCTKANENTLYVRV